MLARGYGRIINIASLSTFVALYEVGRLRRQQSRRRLADPDRSPSSGRSTACWSTPSPPASSAPRSTAKLLDSTPRGQEFLTRTPMGRFGNTDELIGAAIYLASDAASFVAGQILAVDGGFLASGVNQ